MADTNDLLRSSPAPHFKAFKLRIYDLFYEVFSTIHSYAPEAAYHYFLPKIKSILLPPSILLNICILSTRSIYAFRVTLTVNNDNTRVGTLIVATIYSQLIQNRYMFRSFTVLHCSHQHCLQPVASDVEVVGYL